ncbi:MAG: gliding motility-associated C-terminal domain-containing protein [Bacteroidia bacterium]|nr:gliding motility-associated C-terminal domain-containing protein [Bacteroidia bacterium]
MQPAGSSSASNPQNLVDCTPNAGAEFIELYNTNPCNAVDISCYILANNIAGTSVAAHGGFRFPAGTIIPPLGFVSIGGANSGATFNLNTLCGTANLNINPAGRWYLPNGDGYMMLYNASGNVVDAIYWTLGAGEASKWGTDTDINTNPTRIPAGTASCPTVLSLSGPANLAIGLAEYIGQSSSGGFSTSRQTDGSSVWVRNAAGTINTCNGSCNISTSTFSITTAISNPTCTSTNGAITITPNPQGNYTYTWTAPAISSTNSATGLTAGQYSVAISNGSCITNTTIVLSAVPCSNYCQPNGNLAIFSNYDGGILTINVDQNIPNLKVGICTYEPIQVNFTGPFVANVTQVIYAGFNSNQNNNNCNLGNFPTSITGVPAGIVTINPPLSPPLVGYTPVHNNGAGPWGGQMIGTAGNCDTTINGGGGNTPDEIVYYFQQATAGTLLFHQTQYNCWINQTLNISAGGNCCILPGNTSCPPISLSVLSSSNVSCFGGSNGAATIVGNGSAGPYTYTWTPGNLSSASQTSLSAGTYTINVTDVNQCSGTGTISISQPTTSISAVITATTHAGCGGGSSSTIFWTEDFGVGCNQGALASVYTGTNGSWTVTNTGINDASANQWFVSATEAGMGVGNCGDGCLGSFTNNRTLHISNVSTSPAAFIFCPAGDCGAAYDTGIGFSNVAADKRAESPQINCLGKSNISLNFNYIEGGATTIDDATLWYFDGAIWNQIDNMPKTIVCSSGQGQWAARNIVLPASANNNPNIKIGFRWVNNDDGAGTDPSFAVDDISLTASSTNGASGGATVTVSGGTPSYTYSWIPSGGTTAGVTNLSAGSNSVLVTDANGCIALATTNISSTAGPTVAISSQANVTCFGANTGTATINTSGGTAPYSYTWTPGNLSSAAQTSLSSGIYTINVADVNQCAGAATLTISQPTSALTAIISSTSATGCGTSTGGATVSATGGTPGYTYSWTPSGGTTASVANLSTGSNSVTVIDNNGCSIMVIATIITASGPTLSVLSQTNILCNNDATGLATINANGGLAPYTYSWVPTGGNSNSASGLTAGDYTITVTDASQCESLINLTITEALPISFTLSSSPALCGNVGGSATVTATGGVAPLTILWADGSSNATIGNLTAGSYFVTITDANNCSESGNVVVELLSTQTINGTPCIIEIPNIITPNNDNVNDFFKIKNLEYFPNTSVSIFNRWGTKLYENANYKNEWNADGISDGTYFYIITVTKDQQYKGYVTVFRTN